MEFTFIISHRHQKDRGKLPLSKLLSRSVQHVFNENPVAAVACVEILKRQERYSSLYSACARFESKVPNDSGYAPVLRLKAECCRYGFGTPIDMEKAYEAMKKYHSYIQDKKDASVQAFLGDCALEIAAQLQEKAFGSKDELKVLKWKGTAQKHLQQAADWGDVPSMLKIAEDRDTTYNTAFTYYKKAFYAGAYWAAAEIFWRYIHALKQGFLPERFNMDRLVAQLTEGAEAGDPDCMLALALCYSEEFVGHFGDFKYQSPETRSRLRYSLTRDPQQFFYWLKKAYDSGCKDPGVQIMMAEYFAMGKIWNRPEFNQAPAYVAEEFESQPEKALAMVEKVKPQLDMSPLENDQRKTYWYRAYRFLITALNLDCFGRKSDLKSACEYIGAEYNGESLIVPKRDYTKLMALRKALNEAYGFLEDNGYYPIICEEED